MFRVAHVDQGEKWACVSENVSRR